MDDFADKISSILSDEESMRQIGELAAMLGLSPDGEGGNPPENSAPSTDNFDMGAVAGLMQKMKGFQPDDDNTRFLLALRPLLGEEKQNKIDRAVKILRLLNLLPLISESGLLGGDFLAGL
ncbi:MAG: hypothetical protein LUF29_03275 [Oscillospiraceae bacterium]|nr:hypothetical protein [Oscillospiraceae bacterium]